MKDKRDQLYNNLINSGKVSEAEIGNLDEFKSAISDEAKTREFYNNIIKSGLLTEDEIGNEDDFYGSISDDFASAPQQPQAPAPSQGYRPSAEDMAAFGKTIGGARQAVGQSQQAVTRIGNMQQRAGLDLPQDGRFTLGQNRKVTPGQQRYNLDTGQMEQTYVTEQGNEYGSRELADLEQNAVDQEEWRRNNPEKALESDVDRQIADLQAKRDEAYNAALEKARAATVPQSGIGKAIHDFFTPENGTMLTQDRATAIAMNDKNVAALDVALRDLQEAKTMMERNRQLSKSSDFLGGVGIPFTKDWFNNWKNFGYGVWDSMGDVAFNAFGNNDIQKASAYLRIKDKMEKGEELTDTETDMALAGMALAQAQQLADLPTGYTAGQTTLEMAPFMLQMAANPAGGIGKALARKAVKKFGRNGLKAVTARMAARIGGNIGEAAVLSNTLQAGKTAADIAMRNAGDSFSYDENGNLVQGHYVKDENGEDVFVEGGKDFGQSIYEGEAASIIENFTELGFGGNIGKALSKAAGSKLGSKIGLGYISDLVGKVGSTPFARGMKRFMERTHWDGMIEEPLEEEYGIILNSLLTGDNQISDLWDSKQQADIFAGTMWFGGMMAAMNTAAYPFAKRSMKRKLNNADVEGEMAFRDEWPAMKAAIDGMEDDKIADFLYGLKGDKNFSREQKAAMFGYAARLKEYQGANVADMLMRMEGNLSNDETVIKNAYDAGTEIEDPDEMKASVDEAEAAGQKLTQYGPEFTSMVVNGSVDPASTINYMMNNRDYYSDEEIAAAADYYQKHARAQGVMDGQLDKIDLEVQKANAEVASNTHQATGQVITAQSGDGIYYIIGGDIAREETTGMPIVTGTGGAVVVKDALTGEVVVKPAQDVRITSLTNAEDMVRYNEEVLRQQLMQQADDDITYGSPASEVFDLDDTVTLQDGEGGVIEGQVVTLPNAVDGVFVIQTNDGRALQMTADEMNRRIVAHNGAEVQRASTMSPTSDQVSDQVPENAETGTGVNGNVPEGQINGQINQPGTPSEGVQQPENQPEGKGKETESQQSALSRIPVRTDKEGQPLKNKKGRPILDWHKASVEDAAAALVETTGGDMVLARDTASDLVKNEQARLEKIRKQKPTGDDPIEIAESRVAIRKQEQEQQAIIKQWQDVGSHLRKQMEAEAAEKRAAEEAAKSEEQRQREAEEARIRKEKQDAIAAERRRKQIEEEVANWNKPYAPLAKARKEMEGDREAMDILNRTEPESLEEWVSSLIQPQSMMWDDETDPVTGRTVIGLQSELGLQKKDIERIGGLVAPRSKGGKPFGQVVHDIWEALPEGMKEMYDDQDVRNALIGLFGEGNTMRMRHLTEEHRIEEARQLQKENARRDAEAEMDAWAEFYHLTPEERETFEDFMSTEPPYAVEENIINQIIADNEQNRTSARLDSPDVSGGNAGEVEGGEGQIRQAAETAGNGNPEQESAEAGEAAAGEQAPADNNVPGGESIFVTPVLNVSLSRQLVNDLAEAYASGDPSAIKSAVVAMKAYVDEGGDFENREDDSIWDYDGNDPQKLALQYKSHLLLDTYFEDDEDQEYIKTGLKPEMRQNPASPDEQFTQPKLGVYPAQTDSLPSLNSEEEAGKPSESSKPYASFEDMVADTDVTVTDSGMKRALRKIVDKVFSHGSSNTRKDPRGFDYRFVYLVDGTNKSDRVLLKPWESSNDIEYNDDNPTATWVDEAEQRIYFIKFQPSWKIPSSNFIIVGYKSMSQPIGKTSTPAEIKAEEAKVDTNPTEGQKEAGNYQKGHINIDGYDISIENPKGSIRRGTDANGKEWETTMHNTYGYIRGTEGVDGDHIDVFLSDEPASGSVFVVDQVNPSTGDFDEHKVMYGFNSEENARQAYLSNYQEGWGGLGAITEVSREEFKKWVESSHRKTKPFAGYKSVKKEQPKPEKQHKRIVSDDQMEDLKKKLREKFGTLNAGIDVERMLLGAMYAVGKIERGVTKFADYAAEMVEEIGDAIRPYLKAFYEAVRNMPEAAEYRDQMDSPEYVASFDEYNFDKATAPNAFTKAEQVVQKQKAKRQVKKIEKEVKQKIQGGVQQLDLFGEQPQQAEQPKAKEPKGKTAWWSDPNRPQNLDPKDYKTYTTDEAKEYFKNFIGPEDKNGRHFPDFTKWAHPDLAYITAAAWDGANIPVEELMQIPEIIEAEERIKAKKGSLNINETEQQQHVAHLLDDEHGSAVYENGKIKKVNGEPQFTGPVRQERKAFIVIGLPAGGKSSVFANPLSNENGARIIDSDVVKPWLSGYDEGYGAGYVQIASAKVADKAMMEAAKRGDNMVIPRIGGNSLIPQVVIPLREIGYDVQLYWNDVSEVSSIMRAASQFAEEGRYLSLGFLTKSERKDSKTFSNFAEKKLGDYYAERKQQEAADSGHSVSPSGRDADVLADRGSDNGRAESSGVGTGSGVSEMVQGAGEREGSERGGKEVPEGELIFSYAEWKSNDVAFGEKPKEIWNSKSGKPMPGKEKESNDNNNELHRVRSEQGLSAESSPSGEGTGQASGSAERLGAERGPEQDRAERSGRGHSVETTSHRGLDAAGSTTATGGKPKPLHNNSRNNVGERGKDYAPLSPKARFNANVEAIKLMRQLMDEGVENPTQEQKEILRKYSGWGGMGTFFNDATTPEYRTLMDLLDDDEFKTAAMSINSAYFTPATVIDSMWDIAEAMGFKGGNVLEGSAGIGNIIGQMPQKISRQSDIEAVEIDKISGNILKLLYPDAKVHIQGFQDTKIPNGSVDLAITNVPFVTGLHVFDKVDKDLSRKFTNIHDFCIAKNIRKLREEGIGIFISSSGTLDKSNDLRAWITDEGQADVVGAFRLNNETFGGTTATSDIIIVRKRVSNQKSPNAIDISSASPMRVGSYEDKSGNEKQTTMTVNDYFQQHPEMMAGEMAFGYERGDTFRPGSYGLYPVEGKSQEKMLQGFVKEMANKKETASTKPQTQQEPVTNQLTAEKEGRMLIDDNGRLCVSRMGTAVPLSLNDQKVKGQTKQQCFKDYQEVQKAVDDVLQQQLNDPDDAKLQPKLKALNAAYDKFTKRYGTLHKNTSISFLRNDIDFPSFLALENYSETKDMKGKVIVTTKKAPLFSQRVLGFKTEPKPKTVKDAVIASMFRSNGIDLEWIAEKLSEVAAPPNGDKWTADDVRKGILVSRLGFEDPSTGQIEIRYKYLSGNVREKLAIAEAYNTDGKYAANVEELRKAVPMDIPSHLIEFSIGSSWIPVELYKDYLKEVYDLDNVSLSHVEGSWVMSDGWYRNEKNRAAGVYSEQFRETIYGHQLVAAAMNNRPIKVAKQVSEGYGSNKTTRTVVDKNATQACAVRIDEIKDEFKQWAKKKMQDNPELSARIEKIYNDKFNALVPMEIDEEFLPEHFEGSNVNITLRPHQKTGTMRGLTAPTMLAHAVGTGKSFTLITTAMEMRRLGTARKPMLVVQNATVAQLTSDAKLLYPNAKVLALTEKDRDAEGRRAFYASIKYNDWDLIIIPQSTLNMIPDSPERELQFIQEKIDEKKHVIEAAMQSGMDSREIQRLKKELDKLEEEYGDTYLDKDPANGGGKKKKKDTKREAASLDKAETKAKEQLDRQTDDVQYFDDLGVDALLVDEAHEYKHLGFQTSIGRGIKGIDPSYSKKCAGLYNKTRSVYEKAGWKNVVFATGTPISNTAAEIWTFMKYLMPADMMRANDIYYFDDFVHNFGSISQSLEFATSGKFKENTRFAAYVNRPELIRIWSQVADTVVLKDSKEVLAKLPKKEGGKDQDIFLPQSPSLVRIMTAVRAELERFENMTGQEKKENSSIPLTMYGIAKRAAIDPRLVDPNAPDEPTSKTNSAVKEIVKDLKATAAYKGTVAVFCDNQNRLGTNAAGKKVVEFNIYDDMKQKLMAKGVPESQIAIVKSGMSITAKQKIFDAVNAGTIRVVLGSTQTLGTGVNMQERLHLLIHMDAPDRPMDYTQRNGRIERQGNLHKEWGKTIRIIRFGVEDSLDVTAYQRLKTKSGFIDSIMDGKAALANNQVDRTVEEEEEGLFDNPVAVLSGSQYALKKNQAERELRKYQGKKSQWEADQTYVTNQLRRNRREVESAEASIKDEEKDLAHIRSLFPDGKVKTITVEGVKIDMTKDSGAKLFGEALKEKVNDPVNAIVKRNRENPIYNDETMEFTIALDGHDVNFKVQIMRESVVEQGKMRTVIHKYTSYTSPDLRLDSFTTSKSVRDCLDEIIDQVVTGQDYQDRIDAYRAKIDRLNAESEQLEKRVGMEFQYGKELEQAQKNVEEYTQLMKKEMEEKEAKYAAQQKEAKENGGFDLSKAEDSEDDEDVRFSADEDWEETDDEPLFRTDEDKVEYADEKALNEKYPGFDKAFAVVTNDYTGDRYVVFKGSYEDAVNIYNKVHPDSPVKLDAEGFIEGYGEEDVYNWANDELKAAQESLGYHEPPKIVSTHVGFEEYERTINSENFKNFFGDYEKDPDNASKVVDENGKPMIVYHGTDLTLVNHSEPFWQFYDDSHFGTLGQATFRRDSFEWMPKTTDALKQQSRVLPQRKTITKIYPVYLNIRNPKRVSDVPKDWEETHAEYWQEQIEKAKQQGYDGIVYLNEYEDTKHPADSWIAFYPEQIKSADANRGTYDPTDRDIRHRQREIFSDGQAFPIQSTYSYSQYDVTGQRRTYMTDLLPDTFMSLQSMLDAVRNAYPDYYATIEGNSIKMQSWDGVLAEAENARDIRESRVSRASKGAESYVERKTRRAAEAVNDMARRMHLDVEVLTTTEGLTGKKARSKGWFNPKTHKIVIVLPNHRTQSDVINTLLHEGVAHYGLRNMFGENFNVFLDNVYANVSMEIRARIDAAMARNGWSRHEATEEYLARLAEQTDFEHAVNSGWWQKIKDFFMEMLAKAGFNTELTDNELRYILWRSYDHLIHPDNRRTFFDTAKEIQMKTRLKVGDYAERIRIQRTGRVDTSSMVAEQKPMSEAEEYTDDELYRDDDSWTDDVAKDMYEEAVAKDSLKWQESWQDSMIGLKAIQDAIAEETGREATGAEDAYKFENRMHGRAKNMTEQYDWRFYRPMLEAFNDFCKARGLTQQQGMEYLISKSGLERNVYYAFRDAAKAKLTEDLEKKRDKLEKDYAKKLIDEGDYILAKKELEEDERTGVDDIMRQVRETLAYQRAKEDYQNGDIGYTEYIRRIEAVIRSHVKQYDDYTKDYSGLTETFAKEMYDDAQAVRKQAQKAVDTKERRELWNEYNELMRQAYITAREVAEDAVFAAEDGDGGQHGQLWEKINAATEETLKHNYESGMMDRKTYDKVRGMFDYYIPLRGWEEDKAADVYTYMGKDNVFSPAVKKTWGRKSKAENPLAYIGNIAVSTILMGHRNLMKQHFLNYVMNNPTSLVNISESWYENIGTEGDRPVWILRTADTAGKSPDEIVQIVNDFNEEMRLKQREGKAMPVTGRLRLDVHATSGQKAEHVVEVQRAGHTYQLYINGNPKAAQALNGTAAKAVSRISQTYLGHEVTKLNRSMAAFFTSKNPAFVVSNLSRDLNMAGASVAVKEGAEYNARFLANVAKVLTPRLATGDVSKKGVKGLFGKGRGVTGMMPKLMAKWKDGKLDMDDETQRLFKEFMDEGGETGFVNMLSVDSFKEKMQKEIKEMNGSSLFGRGAKETSVHKGLRMLGDTFEFYNRCAEDATRFIVYMTSRQMGKTLEESIADAKDVTLNFNRKGTGDKGNAEIRDLFIFVNPAIQALANMYKMATGHPLKFGAVTAAFVAGGMLMPIINQWLLNLLGDDDDKDTYWNLPPWVRKNNFVMWVPGTKNFVTIPLAQEFRVFYGVGEMISSGFMDHPITNVGLEVFSSVADLVPINPTGNGGDLMVDFAPTMVQPLMQVGENIDFTGKPIWKDNQGNKHAPMYEKAYVSTPTWMVKLSEAANSLTGGNEGRKGVVEKYSPFWGDYINNPAVWNHLLQGYFGGMYNTIAKSADVIVTTFSGELPKVYQTPVVNRFLNRPVERDNAGVLGEEYYSLTEERDALQYELRTWQRKAADGEEGAQEHVDEIVGSDEYKRAEVISHYERILKDLKAGEKAATASADKADIKRSISLYKQQMMEELAALDEGKSPLEAATEAYEKAGTLSEKNKLRMRIDRLMMRENGEKPKIKGRAAEVEKALSYITDMEKESRDTNEQYLDLATAQDVLGDARIKAVKAKLKPVADEYKKIQTENPGKAADYYRKHEKELSAYRIIDQQSRLMQKNRKLLGKGGDKAIMKLISNSRSAALKAIEGIN